MAQATVQDADETIAQCPQGLVMGGPGVAVLVVQARAPAEVLSAANACR